MSASAVDAWGAPAGTQPAAQGGDAGGGGAPGSGGGGVGVRRRSRSRLSLSARRAEAAAEAGAGPGAGSASEALVAAAPALNAAGAGDAQIAALPQQGALAEWGRVGVRDAAAVPAWDEAGDFDLLGGGDGAGASGSDEPASSHEELDWADEPSLGADDAMGMEDAVVDSALSSEGGGDDGDEVEGAPPRRRRRMAHARAESEAAEGEVASLSLPSLPQKERGHPQQQQQTSRWGDDGELEDADPDGDAGLAAFGGGFTSASELLRSGTPGGIRRRRSAHVLYDDSDDGGGGLGGAPRPLPVNVAPRAGRGAKAEVEAEADGAAGTPRQMEASLKDDSDDSAALLGAGLDLPMRPRSLPRRAKCAEGDDDKAVAGPSGRAKPKSGHGTAWNDAWVLSDSDEGSGSGDEGDIGVADGLEQDGDVGFAWAGLPPGSGAPAVKRDEIELDSSSDDDFAGGSGSGGSALWQGAEGPPALGEMSEQERVWRARLKHFTPVEDLPRPRNKEERKRVIDYMDQFSGNAKKYGPSAQQTGEPGGARSSGAGSSDYCGWVTVDGVRTFVDNGQEYTGRAAYKRSMKHKQQLQRGPPQ